MEQKTIWQSKTFWFNVVMTIVDFAAFSETVLPIEALPYLTMVQGLGNIVLRVWFTNGGVTLSAKK
jgi:hypothetical protein